MTDKQTLLPTSPIRNPAASSSPTSRPLLLLSPQPKLPSSDTEFSQEEEEQLNEIKPTELNSYVFYGYKPLGIQYIIKRNKIILDVISTVNTPNQKQTSDQSSAGTSESNSNSSEGGLSGSVFKWNQNKKNEFNKVQIGDEIIAIYNSRRERIDLRALRDASDEADESDLPIEMRSSIPKSSSKQTILADLLFSNNHDLVILELVRKDKHSHEERITIGEEVVKVSPKKINERSSVSTLSSLGKNTRVFTVCLSRPLGIRIDTRKGRKHGDAPIVIVSRITPNGAASLWNKNISNQHERIRLGDRLMAYYEPGGGRVNISQWAGKDVAEQIYKLEGETITLEFERIESGCCIIL